MGEEEEEEKDEEGEEEKTRKGKESTPEFNPIKVHSNIRVSEKNGLSPLLGHPVSLDI